MTSNWCLTYLRVQKQFVRVQNILNVFKINCTPSKYIVGVHFFCYLRYWHTWMCIKYCVCLQNYLNAFKIYCTLTIYFWYKQISSFIMIDDDLKGILNFPFFLLLHKTFAIYPTKVDMILFRSFFFPPKRQHYVQR